MNYQNTKLYLSQPPAMELETQKPARFFPTEMLASTHDQEYPSGFKFQSTALFLNVVLPRTPKGLSEPK